MDTESRSDSDVSYEEDGDDEAYSGNSKPDDCDQNNVDFPFEVLTPEDVVKRMNDTIQSVTSIVEISSTSARVLLNHTKWNKEVLLERLYGGNQNKLFEEAKIAYPTLPDEEVVNSKKSCESGEQHECEICCTETVSSNFIGLKCDHIFCFRCWNQYLEVKILDEGMADTICCPKHQCSTILDQETCLTLLQNAKARQAYLKLITNSFVQCNPVLKWCPNRECNCAIQVEYVLMRPVTCQCNTIFCFKCVQNWHSPLKCDRLQQWLQKCEDDSETAHWLTANTKDCPKCKFGIEKNGGCNHMTCRICKYDFCWICETDWNRPAGDGCHVCTKFNYDDTKLKQKTRGNARKLLTRYVFYHDRYMMHKKSLEFEQQLIDDVRNKIQQLHLGGASITQTPILQESVLVLNRCRRTLMFTYAFAYFLEDNNQAHIFMTNQEDLQRATENLSEHLEREMDKERLDDLKLKILHLRHYCLDRCNVLENHVEEGYQNDSWKYMDSS